MANMANAAQAVVLYCEKHPTEEVDMYCRRCKTPACTACLRTFHNDHEFDTIAKYSKRLASDRERFLKDLTAKYERKRKPKRRKFHEVKCHNDHVLSCNVKLLEERRAKLHSIVDELIDNGMKTCQTNNAKLTADLDKLKQKETETDDKIQEMLTTFEKTTMTGLDIIEYYDRLRSLVESMESDLDVAKYRDMLVYREGEVDRGQLQRMVGDVKEVKKESENDKPVTAKTEPQKQAIVETEPKKQDIENTEPKKQVIAKMELKKQAIAETKPKEQDIENTEPMKQAKADSNHAEQKEARTFFSVFRSKKNVKEFKKVSEPKGIEKFTESDETKKASESKEIVKVTETLKAKKASGSRDQLSAFRYNESIVWDIRPVSHDEAWIKYKEIDQFMLLNKSGQVQDTVPYTANYRSFFVMNDKDFISYHHGKQVVVSIEHSGETSTIMNTSPLYPVHVGPALNGNILVTLADGEELTRTADSQRKVQMITPGGEMLHTYEFGEDCLTPIFTAPFRPTQNFNSNVCVINQYDTADGNARSDVCVFYEDGGLKFVYSGHGGEFYPTDICCDSLCNVICTNILDSSVYVIDSDGAFLEYLLTRDTCVTMPSAVALYRDALWVGSSFGEVRVYCYKY